MMQVLRRLGHLDALARENLAVRRDPVNSVALAVSWDPVNRQVVEVGARVLALTRI